MWWKTGGGVDVIVINPYKQKIYIIKSGFSYAVMVVYFVVYGCYFARGFPYCCGLILLDIISM